ncbi:hypothetical protein W97_08406 [Coniosporium apollinis CBS 100218]|uniref:Uncharacterized protein n=1 Tax=Coniosporium apollinis (strain CBS 100218) TaxID=1168221 RepID=R7Z4T7_CONA1|nr:uncharacterized protein W97_08406 [Coniosporium apollinis CBS 100218]EON69093.1 hypothetical protein W97_08406 [Coniosporium apollinis CBS 100218]
MAIHRSASGHHHAFCITRGDMGVDLIYDPAGTKYQTRDTYARRDLGRGEHTSTVVDMQLDADRDEDPFFDALRDPIPHESRDTGRDLDMIAKILKDTNISVFPNEDRAIDTNLDEGWFTDTSTTGAGS